MIDFSYQEGNSVLHRMDPCVKIAGLLIASLIVLCTKGIYSLAISAVLTFLFIRMSKLSVSTVFRPLRHLGFFLIAIWLMNALFYNDGRCLFSKWLICISRTGIIQGTDIVLHTAVVTIFSAIFIRTTTSIEIMEGLEKLMSPLRKLSVPTRDIALIMSIAIQFIPVFFSDLERIRKAQTARGADFSKGSLHSRIRTVIPLVIPAFISAYRRADELAFAIDARGFQSDRDF